MLKTLKGKISIIYFSLVLLIAIVGAVAVINLHGLSGNINALMTDNYRSINAVSNMMDAVERQDSAVLMYINVNKQKGLDLFNANLNTFFKWYNIEVGNITEKGEHELISDINEKYTKYTNDFSQLQEIKNKYGLKQAIGYYNSIIIPDFNNLKQQMWNLVDLNEKAMFKGKDSATKNANNSMYFVLIFTAIAFTGGFLLSTFYSNKFLSPIHTLTQTIKLVKEGDLNKQININSQDEIGELSTEFNNMTKRLLQYEKSTMGTLLAEKNKSLAIVKSFSDPLIVMDTNNKIILLNDAFEELFKINESNAVNKHFLEVIRNSELFDYILSVQDSKADYREKIVFIRQSDEEFYFNVVVTTVKDADSNITGLIVAFQNVTQLKKLERIKTDFIATISHEFKTPLTSIIMGTSMILDESMGILNDEQKSVILTIREDETKLSNLVNELLELSKIESDRAIFNIEPCSIEGIIETSVKQFYEQAQEKDVTLFYELEENLPKVNADFEKITWVINNLVTNALKYTNAGDEISVSAKEEEGKMLVSVKDTGIGIPDEFIDKIFDKFVQVKGYDMEVRGTGLGLAIVKEIIESHKGKIWCNSVIDMGSTFTFTLPLSQEE